MKKCNWLECINKIFNVKKNRKQIIDDHYLPLSVFLVAGKFDKDEIENIFEYGKDFIKELKY